MPFDSMGRNKKGGYRASPYELGVCEKDFFSTQERRAKKPRLPYRSRMRFNSARKKMPARSLHESVLAQPVQVRLGRLGMMAHAGLSLRLAKGDHPRENPHGDEFT